MIITTMCILLYKNTDHIRTVWECREIGFEISYNPHLWHLQFDKEYPFDVRVDENGNKVLVLRKDQQ